MDGYEADDVLGTLAVTQPGPVEVVSTGEADAYFSSRPRGSRLGAWASAQSRPLASRTELKAAVDALDARYGQAEVPRPPNWSGFRVIPAAIEFWRDGEFRLHDRILYSPEGEAWSRTRLYP